MSRVRTKKLKLFGQGHVIFSFTDEDVHLMEDVWLLF